MCHARLNYEINASFETERKVRSDRFLPRGAIRPIWRGDARSLSRLSRRGQRLDNYWQTLWHPSHGEMPVNIYGERRRTKIHAAQSVINLFSRTLGRVWFDESSCVFRDYAPIMENSRSGNRQHLRLRTQLFLILLHELPYLLSVQRRDSRRTIFDSVYQYLWIGTRSRVTCFLRCVSLFRHISRYTCNSTLFKYISQRDAPESTHTRMYLYPLSFSDCEKWNNLAACARIFHLPRGIISREIEAILVKGWSMYAAGKKSCQNLSALTRRGETSGLEGTWVKRVYEVYSK